MRTLLDANVLIALVVSDHVHHDAVETWFAAGDVPFATCPITQGSLVRLLVGRGRRVDTVRAMIDTISGDSRHKFWPDDVSYADVELGGVIGHRQMTDAYLAQLARTHGGRLATFDRGLAQLHSDVADLVPQR